MTVDIRYKEGRPGHQVQKKSNCLLKAPVVARWRNTSGGSSSARRSKLQKPMTMQNNDCHGRPTNKTTRLQKDGKQARNTHTQTLWPCVNKERYVFVLHLGCELQNSGPVHSCSLCAVSGLHQAGRIPEACTGRPALGGLHTVWHLDCTGGNHSHSPTFFLFFLNYCLSFRITPSISVSVNCNLSFFVPPSSPFVKRPSGPGHRGKDDEQLRSRASWLFSSRTGPLVLLIRFPASSLFSFFSHSLSSPLLSFQSGGATDWGSRGTRVSAREGRGDWWHITAIFGSLISPRVSQSFSLMKENIRLFRNTVFYFHSSSQGCTKKQLRSFIFKYEHQNRSYIRAQVPSAGAKEWLMIFRSLSFVDLFVKVQHRLQPTSRLHLMSSASRPALTLFSLL